MDGNGCGDMLARTPAGTPYRVPSGEFSEFSKHNRVKVGGGWSMYNRMVAVRGISGDGRNDLVARDGSGVLWLYRGNGKGGFEVRTRVGSGWGQCDAVVASGDLDQDGRQDMVARTPAGALYVYNANHNGGFSARKQLAETRLKNFTKLS
ncbi:VCBS repeat-containing protein [Streptomyces flavidovirens]|uniref:FG-GAP repeat domain-containing protein n=1 Tax=Streptomyces flavidovirens TaxID=67298 RepID=UPI00344A7978